MLPVPCIASLNPVKYPAGGPRLRLPPPEDLVHALAMAAGFVQHLLDSNPDLVAAVAAGGRSSRKGMLMSYSEHLPTCLDTVSTC